MGDPVISVEGLSKRYLVGHEGRREPYQSLREVLAKKAKSVARRTLDLARGRQIIDGDAIEEFWALRDISFDVRHGEVLGIIGRNGAGKSTLLKILSRITEPTHGRVHVRGRVASLLEVGTGFHGELSGRENVFLNGAILGMTRSEIRSKFDEIVAFAGVEKFLDTPVKRYSSGMYVRLAFAVAAHLEPEVLVVDEVLAVGDAEFQRKCLGKMQEVASGGRTVLFVSHNLAAMESLCSTGLLLRDSRIGAAGPIGEVMGAYLADGRATSAGPGSIFAGPPVGNARFRLERITAYSHAGTAANPTAGEPCELRLLFELKTAGSHDSVCLRIFDETGLPVLNFETVPGFLEQHRHQASDGTMVLSLQLESMPLFPRTYLVGAGLMEHGIGPVSWHPTIGALTVELPGGTLTNGGAPGRVNRAFAKHQWSAHAAVPGS